MCLEAIDANDISIIVAHFIKKAKMTNRKKIDVNPLNSIVPIIILVLVLAGLYFLAKGVFYILSWVSPLLLLAAFLINRQVVIDYVKMLFNLLKTNPLMGVVGLVLSFFLFPVVAAFLFGKALLYRKLGQFSEEIKKRTEGQFVEYEEVQNEAEETTLDLPELEQQPKKKIKIEQNRSSSKKNDDNFSDYEELFD